MSKIDYKKEYKELYMPTSQPSIVDVLTITYVMIEGKGNPNTSQAYKDAVELLYTISYSIKMSKMNHQEPEGYFEHVVPPLEGLWYGEDGYFDGLNIVDKDKFCWKAMIRLPEFVSREYFEQIKQQIKIKKPELDVSLAQYFEYHEGLCVQIMHKGSYDEESSNIIKMNQFTEDNGYINDINELRLHHEIYLGDPRRTKVENIKTVIRHPIKKR